MIFRDRHEAGRRLAAALTPLHLERPIVIGLPRGGVPVAFEVARALGAPLDVLAVRKLGAPRRPEFAVGALAEERIGVFDPEIAAHVGITQAELNRTVERERGELERRIHAYRGERAPRPVAGRTAIVVDDGTATGLTALAAVRALRERGAGRTVVAVPVGSPEAVAKLREEADAVVCLEVPEDLFSVGGWYADFSEVTDQQVTTLLAAAARAREPEPAADARAVTLDVGGPRLSGDLVIPHRARGLVLFAHGSGSSRLSPRNRAVAEILNRRGLATLLFDLLGPDESATQERIFDIPLLAGRLEAVTRWALADVELAGLPIGYFGASTGAAAALRAAGELGDVVGAVVSRGGRPDLAEDRLESVTAPTLLVVGGHDRAVLELNRQAAAHLRCPHEIRLVPGAGHLFEEPGALEMVARLAGDWFALHLTAPVPVAATAI
jgi:predicted phosphoribosyltransferase/pimeloyl-ACP methyl ester carboxylesterase